MSRMLVEDGPATPIEVTPTLRMRGHHVGRIAGAEAGQWLVDYAQNPHGPLLARTTLHLDSADVQRAADTAAEALLVFEGERSDRPIVVGLLASAVIASGSPPQLNSTESAPRTEAVVDADRLVHTARHEIVLRCGKASIHLLSDGSIRIRGTNVLSRASATNRIRGGNVQIN